MLPEKDQLILLELLSNRKLRMREIGEVIKFDDEKELLKCMGRLERWNLIHGSEFWKLTFKGETIAKILASLPNNPKNYSKNLREEIIGFRYCP